MPIDLPQPNPSTGPSPIEPIDVIVIHQVTSRSMEEVLVNNQVWYSVPDRSSDNSKAINNRSFIAIDIIR